VRDGVGGADAAGRGALHHDLARAGRTALRGRGQDDTRRDGVHADAQRAELRGPRARGRLRGSLGGAVQRAEGNAQARDPRTEVDGHPAAGRRHTRDDGDRRRKGMSRACSAGSWEASLLPSRSAARNDSRGRQRWSCRRPVRVGWITWARGADFRALRVGAKVWCDGITFTGVSTPDLGRLGGAMAAGSSPDGRLDDGAGRRWAQRAVAAGASRVSRRAPAWRRPAARITVAAATESRTGRGEVFGRAATRMRDDVDPPTYGVLP